MKTINPTQNIPSKNEAPLNPAYLKGVKGKSWSFPETAENLTITESFIRGLIIVLALPMIALLDWTDHSDLLIFAMPFMFYLEVTAFTMFCPIKAAISHFRLPRQYD